MYNGLLKKSVAMALAAVVFGPAGPAQAADAAAGKSVYNKNCKRCHKLAKGKKFTGPSLFAVVGRKAGDEKFKYSKKFKAKAATGLVWDEKNLDAWLTKPKAFIPGTRMFFKGVKSADDRANLIAYLKTIK